MTTSVEMSLRSAECLDEEKVSPFAIGYLKSAIADEAHETLLKIFLDESKRDPRITRAFLARRTGKAPEQITRALGSPGNWTFGTYALFLAALGYKAKVGAEKLCDMRWDNQCHPLAVQAVWGPVTTTGTKTIFTPSYDGGVGTTAPTLSIEIAQ